MKKIIAFILATAMIMQSTMLCIAVQPETTESQIVETEEEEVHETDCKAVLNREGRLSTTYFSAYPIAAYSTQSMLETRIIEALEAGDMRVYVFDLALTPKDAEVENMISEAMSNALNSSYKYFYFQSGFSYSWGSGYITYINLRYASAYVNTDGTLNTTLVNTRLSEMENAVANALSCVSSDMTEVEKALALHEYLVLNCDYAYDEYLAGAITDDQYSLYGALVLGKAVCQGYAEAYATLLQQIGIDNIFVTSTAVNHAWNLVYVDENWYHVDATWDDPVWQRTSLGRSNNDYADEGYVQHRDFLRSDTEIIETGHTAWDTETPETGNSGVYDAYSFYALSKGMGYYNGYWYYLNPSNNYSICKEKVDGTQTTTIALSKRADYAHLYNGVVYYSNSSSGIYAYNLATGEECLYWDVTDSYSGYEVYEFGIKHQQMVVVLYNSSTSNFLRITIDAPEKELPVLEVILDQSAVTLTSKGQAVTLTATVAPETAANKTVTWTSSNTSVATVDSNGTVTAVANGSATIVATSDDSGCFDTCVITVKIEENKNILIEAFVERLYKVCLDREPDAAGKDDWVNRLATKQVTGIQSAYGFIFSKEFIDKNLCNQDYVEQLYKAFMGREADTIGKEYWIDKLTSGVTREEVFNGFAMSTEFQKLCSEYDIVLGSAIDIPKYGTVPMGTCSICGKEDGVTAFVKRLYDICLDREADMDGLAYWTNQLWNHTNSGSGVAYGFIFSNEFLSKKYGDEDYVEYLYLAFMGRNSDSVGKADWINRINNGWTRKQVFDGFVGSQEFTEICNSYGILKE